MDKTPQQLANELHAAAANAGGAPFIPSGLRDSLSTAAAFAVAVSNAVQQLGEQTAAALNDERTDRRASIKAMEAATVKALQDLQVMHAEQAAQIEALQSSQLAAVAELDARISALEAASTEQPGA